MSTYRVVQWATGAMGTACLRGIIDHPDLELVGVYVYGDAKVGVDAGEIARREPTGVLATNDVEEILALDADVVVHAARIGPYGTHDADLARLLRSGANVLSINGYSHPGSRDDDRTRILRGAAVEGGATLMAAGLNPGFAAEQLAVLLSGLSVSVDSIEIVEHADSRALRDPAYLFDLLGFGADPDTFDPSHPRSPAAALDGMYEEVLAAVAEHLGMRLDKIETDHVVHRAPADIELRAGTVRAGTVSHTNWRWHAWSGGRRRLTMSIHWYVDTTHLDQPDPPLWQVRMTGHPGVKVDVELVKHPDDTTKMTAEQYAVAAEVINSIPHVVAAPPGLAVRPVLTPARDDYATYRP
jgi:2,4-diaminopentanoate dehydrogenase